MTLTMAEPETATVSIVEQDACGIGIEAYQCLRPLITMDVTRRVMTNVPPGVKPGLGPVDGLKQMVANHPEDAIYSPNIKDADDQIPQGTGCCVMNFSKETLPRVGAFWSITMYDAEGFQVANPINRYAIGDRDDLKFNADGSLDIYIQHQPPGKDLECNWLPSAAKGAISLCMCLCAPKASVVNGQRVPPLLKKVK